jgi:hypothetical protein
MFGTSAASKITKRSQDSPDGCGLGVTERTEVDGTDAKPVQNGTVRTRPDSADGICRT